MTSARMVLPVSCMLRRRFFTACHVCANVNYNYNYDIFNNDKHHHHDFSKQNTIHQKKNYILLQRPTCVNTILCDRLRYHSGDSSTATESTSRTCRFLMLNSSVLFTACLITAQFWSSLEYLDKCWPRAILPEPSAPAIIVTINCKKAQVLTVQNVTSLQKHELWSSEQTFYLFKFYTWPVTFCIINGTNTAGVSFTCYS